MVDTAPPALSGASATRHRVLLRHLVTLAPAAATVALLAVAGVYLLSRTTGLPGLIAVPEQIDRIGVLTSSGEVIAAIAAVVLHSRRDVR